MLGSRYILLSVCRCGSTHYILHEGVELVLNQLCLLVGCCTPLCSVSSTFPNKNQRAGYFVVGLFTGKQEPLWNESLNHLFLVGFLTCGWRSPC